VGEIDNGSTLCVFSSEPVVIILIWTIENYKKRRRPSICPCNEYALLWQPHVVDHRLMGASFLSYVKGMMLLFLQY
jgi:hypothetical protein